MCLRPSAGTLVVGLSLFMVVRSLLFLVVRFLSLCGVSLLYFSPFFHSQLFNFRAFDVYNFVFSVCVLSISCFFDLFYFDVCVSLACCLRVVCVSI